MILSCATRLQSTTFQDTRTIIPSKPWVLKRALPSSFRLKLTTHFLSPPNMLHILFQFIGEEKSTCSPDRTFYRPVYCTGWIWWLVLSDKEDCLTPTVVCLNFSASKYLKQEIYIPSNYLYLHDWDHEFNLYGRRCSITSDFYTTQPLYLVTCTILLNNQYLNVCKPHLLIFKQVL